MNASQPRVSSEQYKSPVDLFLLEGKQNGRKETFVFIIPRELLTSRLWGASAIGRIFIDFFSAHSSPIYSAPHTEGMQTSWAFGEGTKGDSTIMRLFLKIARVINDNETFFARVFIFFALSVIQPCV
jgi:hypothetical protein